VTYEWPRLYDFSQLHCDLFGRDLNKLLGYVRHIKSVGRDYGFSACVVGKPDVLPLIWRY